MAIGCQCNDSRGFEKVSVNRKDQLDDGRNRFALYAQRQCPLCPPIEELLDDYSVEYDFFYLTASPDPDKLQVFTRSNEFVALADKDQLPASPALFDRKFNLVLCGQEIIKRHIEVIYA